MVMMSHMIYSNSKFVHTKSHNDPFQHNASSTYLDSKSVDTPDHPRNITPSTEGCHKYYLKINNTLFTVLFQNTENYVFRIV